MGGAGGWDHCMTGLLGCGMTPTDQEEPWWWLHLVVGYWRTCSSSCGLLRLLLLLPSCRGPGGDGGYGGIGNDNSSIAGVQMISSHPHLCVCELGQRVSSGRHSCSVH